MSGDQNTWNTIACHTAERLNNQMFQAHRGIIHSGHSGVFAAFGNDGYANDQKAKREVDAARQCIETGGGTVLGFGTDSEGYSWALLYRADNLLPSKVLDAMWRGWLNEALTPDALAYMELQSRIAESAMLDDLLDIGPQDIISPN